MLLYIYDDDHKHQYLYSISWVTIIKSDEIFMLKRHTWMLYLNSIVFHLFVAIGIYSMVASKVWNLLRHIFFHVLYSFNRQVCKKFVNKFYCRSDFYIYWNWSLEGVRVFCPLDLLIRLSTSIHVSVVSIASLPPGTLEGWKIRSMFNQWLYWLYCIKFAWLTFAPI